MDSIKINDWGKIIILTVGDDVVVVDDPGRSFGAIPHFGQRRRGKVTRVLGRVTSPYVEVAIVGTAEKICFDDRGHIRGTRSGVSRVSPLDIANEESVAAEMRRVAEAREIVRGITAAMPHASQIEKLVWTRPDLVPVLRELIEKINAPPTVTAKKEG